MSYSISAYAEVRRKGSDKWEMLGKDCILREVKHLLLGGPDDNSEIDCWDYYMDLGKDELSKSLAKFLELDDCENFICFKQVDVLELRKDAEKIISDAGNRIKFLCKALGIKVEEEWDGDWYASSGKCYDENGKVSRKFNPLTFPVNKEMVAEVVSLKRKYDLAQFWIGVTAAVLGLSGYRWYGNESPEVRLVFEYR